MFVCFFFFCHTFTAAHNKLNHINISPLLPDATGKWRNSEEVLRSEAAKWDALCNSFGGTGFHL